MYITFFLSKALKQQFSPEIDSYSFLLWVFERDNGELETAKPRTQKASKSYHKTRHRQMQETKLLQIQLKKKKINLLWFLFLRRPKFKFENKSA